MIKYLSALRKIATYNNNNTTSDELYQNVKNKQITL